jgi:lipopolysaccharide heptosyltransferase II
MGAMVRPVKKIRPYQVGRIVVRAPTWVGDAVMSLPALRAVRHLFPGSNITVAARPGTADIFSEADFVDSVLINERGFLPSVSQLRHGKFDLALLLQNSFAAALTSFAARIPLRIGYETDRRGLLLTTAIPVPAWKNERHESLYYLNIVSALQTQVERSAAISSAAPSSALHVSEQRRAAARKLITEAGASSDQPLIVLCPGSVNSRAKRWPAERYAGLSDRFTANGMTVVLIGSAAEVEVSREVSARTERKPIVLTGRTSVAEVVGLISMADLLVTNDTGPAHVGAAVGTPTLVIFGPTNPLTTFPLSPTAEMIREPPDCAPCMLRDCPIDHRCMTAISVDQVFERGRSLARRRAVQLIG